MEIDLVGAMKEVAESVAPKVADMVTKIGVIDPAYTTGRPKVLFDGEASLTGFTQTYTYVNSYKPVASQRVLLVKSGSTWTIIGCVDEVGQGGVIPVSTRADGIGRYYANSINATGLSADQIFSTGTVRYLPVYFAVATKIDRVAITVSPTLVGSTLQMGRYLSGSAGLPTTRLADYGSVSVATTGVKEFTVSETIPAGICWFGFVPIGGNVSVWVVPVAQQAPIVGDTAPTTGSLATFATQATGTLPTTASASSSGGSVPAIWWRVAA